MNPLNLNVSSADFKALSTNFPNPTLHTSFTNQVSIIRSSFANNTARLKIKVHTQLLKDCKESLESIYQSDL